MTQGYITWSVDPVLFHIGSVSVRWYSVLLVLSIYISYLFLKRMFIKEGVSTEIMFSYGIFIITGLIIGGRLMHCLAYEPEYYLKYPLDIIRPWRGELGKNAVFVGYRGMSGHGSAIGIVIGIVLNSIRTKTSIIWMVDRIALFGPLVGFFVRIGNFFNSEILGKATESHIGIILTRADQIPRHPVQLYEAFAYFVIFVFAFRYYQRRVGKEKQGEFLGLILVLVYTARFLLEFFKAKQSDVETTMALNMGHLLSVPFIIVGLALLLRPRSKKEAIKPTRAVT